MENVAKIGTKFTYADERLKHITYTIVDITNTRVIYSNGKTSFCGATNRKQSKHWMSIKGFERGVADCYYVIL